VSGNPEKIKNIVDPYERKVAGFLDRIGFSFVSSRSMFKKSDAEIAREIDLLFTFKKCTFIIEVSTVKSGRNFKIIAFMYRWNRKKNLERLKKKHPAIPNRVMRIFFDLSKPTPENKSQDVEESTEDAGNMIIYKDKFEKLYSNQDAEQAIEDFLGFNWLRRTAKISRF
jgi:Holliday junction resolvase-like predicted endonuclease